MAEVVAVMEEAVMEADMAAAVAMVVVVAVAMEEEDMVILIIIYFNKFTFRIKIRT